jgi:hypothetical protein
MTPLIVSRPTSRSPCMTRSRALPACAMRAIAAGSGVSGSVTMASVNGRIAPWTEVASLSSAESRSTSLRQSMPTTASPRVTG